MRKHFYLLLRRIIHPINYFTSMDRRDFLKNGSLLAGGLLLGNLGMTSCNSKPKPRKIPANEKVNLACIGIGNQGGYIIKALHNTGLCNVVALCDTDMGADHTLEIMNKFPDVPRFQDFRDLFDKMDKQFDAVCIGVPDHSHFPIAMLAMSRGKHVYVEKPMAHTFNEVELMIRAAEKYGVVTQMGNQGHSEANYFQFKTWVEAGIIKDVTAITALEDYKLQLKQLLEMEGNVEMLLYIPELNDNDVLARLPDKESVYASALQTRPEIESGKLNVSASELDIKIAKSSYYPSLSLSAGIGTSHTTGTDYTFSEQIKNGWNNSVGLTLSVPIFSRRQTKSAVEKAQIGLESTKLQLRETEKELYRTIENLWLDAWSAQQQYLAAAERVRSSRTSFDLVSEQFNLGMKNTVELLTEKNNLLSAEQELLQAKYMAILNIQLLKFYQGMEMTL